MRRLLTCVLILAFALTAAAKKVDFSKIAFVKGTFLAFENKPFNQFIGGQTAQSSLLLTHNNYFATIAIGDLAYTANMGNRWGGKDIIIGDPVDAAVDEKYLYFKLPDGTPTRGVIVQRARYKKEK